MKLKSAIVTGGCGFIGSHLVKRLQEEGVRVTVIDKKKPKKSAKLEGVFYKQMDVQSQEAFDLICKKKAEIIFHLAVSDHDRGSVREPVAMAEDNVIGTLNILQAIRTRGFGRMIFASSSVVYGNQETYPVKESATPYPITPFAISKLTAEHYLHFYEHVLQIPSIALRFGNVYGPGQDVSSESGAIGIFAGALLKGRPVYINNDGESTRDYVFIDDAIEALLLAAQSKETGVMNIGTGRETSTNALFEMVREETGSQAKPDSREEIADTLRRNAVDATRAKETLEWEATTTLEEGIKRTVAWYSDHV